MDKIKGCSDRVYLITSNVESFLTKSLHITTSGMVLSGNTSSFTIKSYAIEKTIPTACVRRLLYKKMVCQKQSILRNFNMDK
jgi:hypothetical protein